MSSHHHHHHHCSLRTGGGGGGGASGLRRCDCGDDLSESEKLWNEFEACAQAVARLYSDSSWRNFRGAAEGTTQLYKTSTDSYRRGFEKGFSSGCTSIAKEILSALRGDPSQLDMNIVLEVLYRNMAIPREERIAATTQAAFSAANDTLAAVELFQQALNQPPPTLNTLPPANPRDPTAAGALDEFLANQVQRHRKRQRSPSSPNSQLKRQRRT